MQKAKWCSDPQVATWQEFSARWPRLSCSDDTVPYRTTNDRSGASGGAQRLQGPALPQLTDGLKLMLRSRPVYAYRFEGTRYDAGDKLGFLKATVEFALERRDLGEPFREYLKSLKLG